MNENSVYTKKKAIDRHDPKIVTKLLFRLLPVQVLLVAVVSVNGIVSGLFASNFVGVQAMGAVSLYSPITLAMAAAGGLLQGGIQILTDVMRNALTRYTPIMIAIDVLIMICAEPLTRLFYRDPADPASNIGIRTVYSIAEDVKYQNILGLNVLTITI